MAYMPFTPEERRRVKKILLRKIRVPDEELETLVDSLLDLAVELYRLSRKRGGDGQKWSPPHRK